MAGDPLDESSDRSTSPSPDDSTTPMDPALWKEQGRRSPAALGVGELLANRYKVLRYIGKGGMGEVYEAEDCELRERVALKTILPEIARQEESIQRFKREIQLARKVTHPNVCRIFDLVYHETTIFLTMELLEGETLSQRLRRTGAMTTSEAFPLVAQMAAALGAAHKAGIVHRDFKCGNVMLVRAKGEEGGVRPVIMDFGLARRSAAGDVSMGLSTTTGVISGTPAYMAPEQVEGHDITPAADIYALGIVMYEMVTGRCPFEGDTPLSTAVKRLQEPAPSPRSHNPGLDPRWERAILRCLERNPNDRFASAGEIIKAVEPHAPPVEPSEQPRMLEAAAPKRAAVGRSMQVLAMIRRVESAGLKPFVDIEETAPLTKEDIRAKPFRLEFPLDRKGAPQSAEIVLKLDSPDFEPKSQTKKLMVPPERDSEVCTFLLTPKVSGELLLNLEVLKGEVLVASRAIRTLAEITEQPIAFGQNVLVSIPLEVIAYGLRAAAGAPAGEAQWSPAGQAAAPAPHPAPSAPREFVLKSDGPVSEAAKSMQLAEEPRRSLQTSPPTVVRSAPPTPPRPMASPPRPSMAEPVPPPALNIPGSATEGTVVLSGLRAGPPPVTAAAPRLEPKKPAPAPPRVMPAPPVMARKEAPKKLPITIAAVIALVMIQAVGGYIFLHHPSSGGGGATQAVVTPNTQKQEQQEKDLFNQAKAAQDAKKWDEAIALYNKVADMNGTMKDQALLAIPIIAELQQGTNIAKIEKDTFQQATRALQKKEYNQARGLFQQVIALKVPDSTRAPQAQTELASIEPILQAKAEFDAAVQAQNSGDLKGAQAQFKALAEKPGPMQAQAQARVQEGEQLIASAKMPTPTSTAVPPTAAAPMPTTTAAHNPFVKPLYSGALRPLNLPYHQGMTVADVNVDGGLKATNLALPPVQGAPPGSFVMITIKIDENGSVTPDRVIADPSGFGPQVQEAARAWKFKPPTVRGQPVNTTLTVKVTF